MTSQLYQPLQPLAADVRALGRVLQAAGVDKADSIRVVGLSGALATLLLNQHGYNRAAFALSASTAGRAPVDALLFADPCGTEELADLAANADGLRDGGALIIQPRRGRQGEETEAVAAWLRRAGFVSQRRLNDKGRPICIARRVGWPTAKKAA